MGTTIKRLARAGFLASAVGLPLAASSCSSKVTTQGELIVSVSTDMSIPKDFDAVAFDVSTEAAGTLFHNVFTVGQHEEIRIPATLAILAGSDPSLPVTIRVIAFQTKTNQALVLREAITTVPTNRVATLQMPLEYLSLGSASGSYTDYLNNDAYEVMSNCADGETDIAGVCVSATVDSTTLPDYSPASVYGGGDGGGNGECFDTLMCTSSGATATIDTSNCTFTPDLSSVNGDASNLNIALEFPSSGAGVCDTKGCYVALDGNSSGGWQISGGNVTLPALVCSLLSNKTATAVVYTTSACATKLDGTPTCGSWSSVGNDMSNTPDGGSMPNDGGTQTIPDATMMMGPDAMTAPDGTNGPPDGAATGTPTYIADLPYPVAMTITGGYAFIATQGGIVYAYDISKPAGAAPVGHSKVDTGDAGAASLNYRIDGLGGEAYLSGFDDSLLDTISVSQSSLNVSPFQAPTTIGLNPLAIRVDTLSNIYFSSRAGLTSCVFPCSSTNALTNDTQITDFQVDATGSTPPAVLYVATAATTESSCPVAVGTCNYLPLGAVMVAKDANNVYYTVPSSDGSATGSVSMMSKTNVARTAPASSLIANLPLTPPGMGTPSPIAVDLNPTTFEGGTFSYVYVGAGQTIYAQANIVTSTATPTTLPMAGGVSAIAIDPSTNDVFVVSPGATDSANGNVFRLPRGLK